MLRRRPILAAICLAACGHAAPPAPRSHAAPRLLPPAPIDPGARGATYLTTVALQLQPGWGQFLDDCRLRLPATHALNQLALAATAELAVDRQGRVSDVKLASSGNADFDRAVRDAITAAAPLAAPPQELLSDDDQVHVRWLFARDRRQAGPATAEVVDVLLPLPGVIERLVAAKDLARAARRIIGAPPGPDRVAATERVMIAALREALGSADAAVRRAAVEASGRTHLGELATDVRAMLAVTNDAELRVIAIAAAAALDDREAAAPLLAQLPSDLPEHPRLALAETRALVALGRTADAAKTIRALLDGDRAMPHTIALEALGSVSVPELAPKLAGWFAHGDARVRAAVCVAAAGATLDVAWPWIAGGLRDADATVRATCIDAIAAQGARASPDRRIATAATRLRELVRDRDRAVRAHAIAALVVVDPAHLPIAADDSAAEVRAAFAGALAIAKPPSAEADLRVLIDDRDPDVRAAAWSSLATGKYAARLQLATRAATDSAPQVRFAAIPALGEDELVSLAARDDAPEVRTAALVELAARRGRVAIGDLLLERLAAGPRGSAERVRAALAWLLAR